MTDEAEPPPAPPKRQGRKLPASTIAAILAHAEVHRSDKSAAERFGVSERSVQRYRARVANGKLPEVAQLVAEQTQKAVEVESDILLATFDESLRALRDKLPTMNGYRVVGACKILGELIQGRDLFKRHGNPAGAVQSNPRSGPAKGPDLGAGVPGEGGARPPGSEPGAPRVH